MADRRAQYRAHHRAERTSNVFARSGRGKPRHRRTRLVRRLAIPILLALTIVSGVGTVLASANYRRVDAVSAGPADRSAADVLKARGVVPVSRSGSRVLRGADRLDAIERKAEATIKTLHRREVRRVERRRARERAETRRRQQVRQARQWGPPLERYHITATFGQTSSLWSTVHTGVDLDAVTGTPVRSVGPGTVTFAAYDGSYGNKIVVEHDDGTETWYCHLSQINVSVGAGVTHATVIGLVGATGNVTGDHLHLELRPAGGGDPVDPVVALLAHGIHL